MRHRWPGPPRYSARLTCVPPQSSLHTRRRRKTHQPARWMPCSASPLPAARCLLSAARSHRQARVAAAVVEERFALALAAGEDIADEDAVVAACIRGMEAAIEPGDGGAEEGRTRDRGPVWHAAEGRRDERRAVREAVRQEFVVLRQHIDGER